jgi:hypothetical protein
MSDTLTLPLKAEYFDDIKAGTKPLEFRLANAYWTKRLLNRTFSKVVLTRGYPKANDASRRLIRAWRGCVLMTITHEHFGPIPVTVFGIDVSTPLEPA